MTNWDKIQLYGPPARDAAFRKKSSRQRKKDSAKRRAKKIMHQRRADLIERATPAEKVFKDKLQSLGFNFEFQKIIQTNGSQYIVDFYLKDYHIICEVDGGYHNETEQRLKDLNRERDLLMCHHVSKVIRFTNDEALTQGNDLDIMHRIFPETKGPSPSRKAADTGAVQPRGNLGETDKRTGKALH
jgi:very-short-patch-repair endonuclease